MATGRTISASFLTDLDKQVLELCGTISQTILDFLPTAEAKKHFKENFGKLSKTRDAGAGRGGGKLQRDALCTRGVQGKAPFSNRNFRWHPLIIAHNSIPSAKLIKRIEIEGEDNLQTLVFVIEDTNGNEICFPSDKVHELPERYVVLPEHWLSHIEKLKLWNDLLWTQNSCIITAYEACDWQSAVESYAILGISVGVNFYNIDFTELYEKVFQMLKLNTNSVLPGVNFPKDKDDIISCPLCKIFASQNPAKMVDRKRELRWKPDWAGNKRGEGEDSSMQIMHVEPLTEIEMRHNAVNVRFGHRWCNVAMTDHSIKETVDFMEYIVKAHNRV